MPREILPQDLFSRTLRFDKISPVEARNRAQAVDAVRYGDLRQRDHPVRSRDRYFRAWPVFGYPLLEPHERSKVDLIAADLMKEPRNERRSEWRMIVDEAFERVCQSFRRCIVCSHYLRSKLIGELYFIEPCLHPQRHPSDVLDEPQSQHRRDRPQFTHRERRYLLILAHEQRDVVEREMAFGVRDQLD